VRAGNVIGGGDWAGDRLVPDIVRAVQAGRPVALRCPAAVRPWQHALDALHGYLMLAARLLDGDRQLAGAWNFGPDPADVRTVLDVLKELRRQWPGIEYRSRRRVEHPGTPVLTVDSSKARTLLSWQPVWTFSKSIEMTAAWYRRYVECGEVASREQLYEYASAVNELERQAAVRLGERYERQPARGHTVVA
jgi:CDP-glucose 4,6-dehydratase